MNTSQALAIVLDGDHVSELYGKRVQVCHLRIKPGVALIAALNDVATGQAEGWLRLLWPVSHSKAAKAHAHAQQWGQHTHSRHVTPQILADWGAITADPVLAGHIARWTDTRGANANAQLALECGLLRYNPLRRLVVCEGEKVTRIQARPTPIVHHVMSLIARSVPTPEMADTDPTAQVSSVAFCGDGDLSTLTAHSEDSDYIFRAHEHAGRLLAHLHAVEIGTDSPEGAHLREALAQRTPHVQVKAGAHAGILDHLDADAAQRTRTLAQRMDAREKDITSGGAAPLVLSHGDASADQILARADLSHMWLTDFDRVCLAQPALDLGSYLSLCTDKESQAVLAGYTAAGGHTPHADALHLAVAQALMSRLAEPLKAGNLQWQSRIHQQLDTIQEILS